VEVGEEPEGIDITPDGRTIYVANWGDNSVTLIDMATLKVTNTIETRNGSRAFGLFIR